MIQRRNFLAASALAATAAAASAAFPAFALAQNSGHSCMAAGSIEKFEASKISRA